VKKIRPILSAEDEEIRPHDSGNGILKEPNSPCPLVLVRDGQEPWIILRKGSVPDRAATHCPPCCSRSENARMNGFDVLAWLAEQPDFKKILQ